MMPSTNRYSFTSISTSSSFCSDVKERRDLGQVEDIPVLMECTDTTQRLKKMISKNQLRRFSTALESFSEKHLGSTPGRRLFHGRHSPRARDTDALMIGGAYQGRSHSICDELDHRTDLRTRASLPGFSDEGLPEQPYRAQDGHPAHRKGIRSASISHQVLRSGEIPQERELQNAYDMLLFKTLTLKAREEDLNYRRDLARTAFEEAPNYIYLTPPPPPSPKRKSLADKRDDGHLAVYTRLSQDISQVLDPL